LPFLDTDIGRGTVLIGRSDFEFFLQENNLCLEEYPSDTRYIVLQFIEIGIQKVFFFFQLEIILKFGSFSV
jgi:hypothetical protein